MRKENRMNEKIEFEMLKLIIQQNNLIGYMLGTESKKIKDIILKSLKL